MRNRRKFCSTANSPTRLAARQPIPIILGLLLFELGAMPAAAQIDLEWVAAIRECADLANDRARLACYDGLAEDAAPPAVAVPPAPAAAPVPDSPPAPAAAAVPATAPAPAAAAVPATAPAPAAQTAPPDPSRFTRAAEAPLPYTGADAIAAFGFADPDLLPDSIDVQIVNIETRANGQMILSTATGQVWLQTRDYNRRFPMPPFAATISQAALGSYFLRASSGGRSIRVARQR